MLVLGMEASKSRFNDTPGVGRLIGVPCYPSAGLGRLAACYLDSGASMELPLW